MVYRLTTKQKWHLAATLLLLYYPVLLYIDLPVYLQGGSKVGAMLCHEITNIAVVLVMFFLWVGASEWLLHILLRKFGESFLLEFRLPAMVFTLALAIAMGFAFVVASHQVLLAIDTLILSVANTRVLVSFPQTYSHEFGELYKRTNIGFFLLIMLGAFYLIANRRAQLRADTMKLHAERLEKENTQAQLLALRNQVNPHFLFNSLSILSSLVHEDAGLSEKFIDRLARFYRYTLEQEKHDTVLMSVELEFVRSYIYLLTARFGEKLQITLPHHNEYEQYRIAPLTLQLLIENAVKHNQMADDDPLCITVKIADNYLVVTNILRQRGQLPASTRVGLKNIVDRYALLTPLPVNITETNGHFQVAIPLLDPYKTEPGL